MNSVIKSASVALLSLSLAAMAFAPSAQSQSTTATPEKTGGTESANQGWHVDVAPYLWFPGINGTVGALGHEAGVSVHGSQRFVLFRFWADGRGGGPLRAHHHPSRFHVG
jgi:hypothetical protein